MSSRVRNFIISFIIATLIFSLVAIYGVKLIDKYVLNPESEKTEEITEEPTDIPETTEPTKTAETVLGNGKSFNFVLIGSDYQPDVYDDYDVPNDGKLTPARPICADTIIFGMFSKEHNEFIITPIDPDTMVSLNGARMTLGRAFGYAGEKFVCDKVSLMVGLAIDYYASVEIDSLIEIIDHLGGVDYDVPETIEFVEYVKKDNKEDNDEDDDEYEKKSIVLQKGEQHLTGEQALALLRFDDYVGKINRMDLGADFTISVIKQLTADYLNKQNYKSMYTFCASRVKTNYTLAALEENLDMIFRFSSMSVTYITYPGKETDKGFEADMKQGNEIFTKYR